LAFLAPGVTGGAFYANVNGSQRFAEEVEIDGVSIQIGAHTSSTLYLTLVPEAVQEFSVATGGNSAEYGNMEGGVERYTVRSGTNSFHGNMYEYVRNQILDARGFFLAAPAIN